MNKVNQTKVAPILLFTHRRYSTLRKTINSLKNNYGFQNHELYIFSDGPRNNKEIAQIKKVRKFLAKIKGFKKKKIFMRKKNFGLAQNILNGVSQIIKIKKKAIIIEDDLILNQNFLNYMNECLLNFKNEKKIWHINGWNYDFRFPQKRENTFFWRGMSCWGWATWDDRWKYYKKNSSALIKKWNKDKIYGFNYDGTYNFWSQVLRNNKKVYKTWAIFWYATIFEKKGLCVSPIKSLTQNIGNDKYANNKINTENSLFSKNKNFARKKKSKFLFCKDINENSFIYYLIKKNLISNMRIKSKFKYFLKKLMK